MGVLTGGRLGAWPHLGGDERGGVDRHGLPVVLGQEVVDAGSSGGALGGGDNTTGPGKSRGGGGGGGCS